MATIEPDVIEISSAYPEINSSQDEETIDIVDAYPELSDSNQGDGLSGQLENRYQKTANMVERNFSGGVASDIGNLPKVAVLATGQVAGGVNDAVGAAVGKFAGAVTPEPVKEFASEKFGEFLSTDIGKLGISALQKGKGYWDEFAETYPDAAMTLETGVNLSAFGAIKGFSRIVSKEMRDIAFDVTHSGVRNTKDRIDRVIKYGIEKGIRPTVVGKSSFKKSAKYDEKASTAVQAIIENKSSLELNDAFTGEVFKGEVPKSLHQFSQAIAQTEEVLFKKFNDMAKKTGGYTIDMEDIIPELEKFAGSRPKRFVHGEHPGVYAFRKMDEISKYGKIDAVEAQEIIKELNFKLNNFYKNPTQSGMSESVIDALIANRLRKKLDDAITSSQGPGYQELKIQYGALKTIEKEVAQRMIVDARKNPKGLIDFSDIFSGAQAINALATNNPALFAAATTAKGISALYKQRNDPNMIIKKMFEHVEELSAEGSGVHKSILFQQKAKLDESLPALKKLKENDPSGINTREVLNSLNENRSGVPQ